MFHYPCIRCGICCRNIGEIELLQDLNDGSGVCLNLRPDNLCGIYSRRPFWCNVTDTYNVVFRQVMPEHEFIASNLAICIELNRWFGNDENCLKLSGALKQNREPNFNQELTG
jgi:Fe-S-cluster containining protein